MRMRSVFTSIMGGDKFIAFFGQARLVKTASGGYELRGGTTDDHSAAREWISLFMHDAVLSQEPQLHPSRPG